MKTYGIKRKLEIVRKNVKREITALAERGRYAAAIASEGYWGGYMDAINDVELALHGNNPRRYRIWDKGDA